MLSTVRRQAYRMRTEGAGRARQAAAIGLGVFVGTSPFFGFHLLLCWVFGKLFGLNRLTIYLAAQISNPLIVPFLLFVEVQTGAWLSRGATHALTIETLKRLDPRGFGLDLFVGWAVVGGALAVAGAAATYAVAGSRDPIFALLVERAADRYVGQSLVAWEFARGKMYRDPIYDTILRGGLLPSGETLIDVGCGQGLMLTLLIEAGAVDNSAAWATARPTPRFNRLIGIETRPRVAHLARVAVGDQAMVIDGDVHVTELLPCSAVLIIDVLHMMPGDMQTRLLGRLKPLLDPDGVMLIREADASAGWQFAIVRIVNWLQAARQGWWRQGFQFRTRQDWIALFAQCGLAAEVVEQKGGASLGNVLFRVRHV